MPSPQTIPSLQRSVELLTAVAESSNGLSAKQLVLHLDIPQATCYRILRTLVLCGWLQETNEGLYRPAYELTRLTRSWSALEKRLTEAKPKLEALAEMTKLSAKISILEGTQAVIAMRSRIVRPFSITSPVGSRVPLESSGSAGVILLAALNEKEQARLLKKMTGQKQKNLSRLVVEARKHQISRAYGTDHPSVYAVSVPVDADVPVALTLVGWPDDFAKGRKKVVEQTLKAHRLEFALTS